MSHPARHLSRLCRGKPEELADDLRPGNHTPAIYLGIIIGGAGVYGATMGLWRAPIQGLFTAIKFPLLMLLTTAGNALLNGMLAQLMGLKLSFRDSTLAIMASFAVTSIILASLSPVTLFILINTPPLGEGSVVLSHNFNLMAHVSLIAFAGVMGNVTLFRLLALRCGSRQQATKALVAWMIGNMFLGCQLSWLLRPFIGSPNLPVEFLRADAFQGNFFESVRQSLINLLAG
ncbi:MAG: hypothetical protein O3A51_09965 [Verrucomicrobia bacterium]|nr:hypothetical protein [Verrucomicrobiota bacterium]